MAGVPSRDVYTNSMCTAKKMEQEGVFDRFSFCSHSLEVTAKHQPTNQKTLQRTSAGRTRGARDRTQCSGRSSCGYPHSCVLKLTLFSYGKYASVCKPSCACPHGVRTGAFSATPGQTRQAPCCSQTSRLAHSPSSSRLGDRPVNSLLVTCRASESPAD